MVSGTITFLLSGLHGVALAEPLGSGELLRLQQDSEEARPVDRVHDQG